MSSTSSGPSEAPVGEQGFRELSAPGKVVIVDSQPIFRHGVRAALSEDGAFTVVAEASCTAEALHLLRRVSCDALITDIPLAGTNGIELMKLVRAEHPRLPILVLSLHAECVFGLRAIRAGARGFVSKLADPTAVLRALHEICLGELAISATLSHQLWGISVAAGECDGPGPVGCLSDRELEVLEHVGQGRSTQDIAKRLGLSSKTIESHRLHVKQKLGLSDTAAMRAFAQRWYEDSCGLRPLDGGPVMESRN